MPEKAETKMDPEKASAVDTFFKDLPEADQQDADIFDESPKNETPPAKGDAEETPEKGESEPRKNRRERRAEQAWQRERTSAIALNNRVIELSEQVARLTGNAPTHLDADEVPTEWIALYGDTPEARKAWKVNESLLRNYAMQAKESALEEIETRQRDAAKQESEFEQFIDSSLESIEDAYDIDLTSNAPAARKDRREFLSLVQNLSPKDENGNITGYADFNATWEMYQLKRGAPKQNETVNKAKELSSRSMERSGGTETPAKKPTPGFRGWMKDFNLPTQ